MVFPAVAAGWRELGSWVWELMGLGAAWCKLHTIWTEHAAGGDRDKGARERGSEGREDEKEFEFGRPEHNQCTIAAEEREGGARDKSSQDKKDKTSRGRDY